MKWAVKIFGKIDIDELEFKYDNSRNLSIIKIDNDYYIQSEMFEQSDNPEEIFNLAKDLMILIRSAIKIANDIDANLYVDMVRNLETKCSYIFVFDTGNMIDRVSVLNNTYEVEGENKLFSNIIDAGFSNDNVNKVLRLIEYEGLEDWGNIYRILEIIQVDINIIEKGWASKKEIKNFKHTANSPKTIGNMARHGCLKGDPPEHPMSIVEAKEFILRIIKKWIDSIVKTNI